MQVPTERRALHRLLVARVAQRARLLQHVECSVLGGAHAHLVRLARLTAQPAQRARPVEAAQVHRVPVRARRLIAKAAEPRAVVHQADANATVLYFAQWKLRLQQGIAKLAARECGTHGVGRVEIAEHHGHELRAFEVAEEGRGHNLRLRALQPRAQRVRNRPNDFKEFGGFVLQKHLGFQHVAKVLGDLVNVRCASRSTWSGIFTAS